MEPVSQGVSINQGPSIRQAIETRRRIGCARHHAGRPAVGTRRLPQQSRKGLGGVLAGRRTPAGQAFNHVIGVDRQSPTPRGDLWPIRKT